MKRTYGPRGLAVATIAAATACFGCGANFQESINTACTPNPNGCGPAGFLGPLVPECPVPGACFTPACSVHDNCYRICGVDKDVCDADFLADMRDACDEAFAASDPQRLVCNSTAYIYFEAVQRLGNEVFALTQLLGCFCDNNATLRAYTPSSTIDVTQVVAPFLDADDDLLPDEWELQVGLNPDDPDDAMLDGDGDGFNNVVEYLYGADPFDAATP